ncbi:MAG: FAD-dependent oxidoreductase [Verrucomicrobia bacterium]|jgi:flavin-dependent dehydrogenase|nr:FAD-dependent oxidoreductase [Verrucomicrobiota bacterium]
MNRRQFLQTSGIITAGALLADDTHALSVVAQVPYTYDVIVYSAVPCGIAAAIHAAREGAKVLLIEQTKHVGGLSTSGINTAESEHMLKWTIGGFADEFYRRLGKHYEDTKDQQSKLKEGDRLNTAYFFESSVAEKVYLDMLNEAKVELVYGIQVEKVVKTGTKITSITMSNGLSLSAKVFIDASYEGDLMSRAGVKYAIGRESKAEFGEEAAGIRFDKTPRKATTVDAQGNLLPGISAWAKDLKEGDAHRSPMNYNFRLCFAKDKNLQVPIPAPKHYDRKRYQLLENWFTEKTAKKEAVKLTDILDFYARRNGKYEVNNKQAAIFSIGHFGGQFEYSDADYAKREKIIEDHWDYTLGLLHFLANEESVPENVRTEMRSWGLHKEEFKDNGNLPYQLYVREARRMRGEHIVTQMDVQENRRKPDSIGLSSHFIDSHHVQRVALSPTEFVNEGRIWRVSRAYQMPYRAFTPKKAECENLLVPGAASFTHVAFCSYRLESVWMIAGHACGVAAAMAAKAKQTVHNVDVPKLQEKLRAQKQVVDFIPDQPEFWYDVNKTPNGPPEF